MVCLSFECCRRKSRSSAKNSHVNSSHVTKVLSSPASPEIIAQKKFSSSWKSNEITSEQNSEAKRKETVACVGLWKVIESRTNLRRDSMLVNSKWQNGKAQICVLLFRGESIWAATTKTKAGNVHFNINSSPSLNLVTFKIESSANLMSSMSKEGAERKRCDKKNTSVHEEPSSKVYEPHVSFANNQLSFSLPVSLWLILGA